MTEVDRELARRLFVAATAMLEDAIEIASPGNRRSGMRENWWN